MQWVYSDGGRVAAGYKGKTGDCVVRAIAIATEMPYKQVYNDLFEYGKIYGNTKRNKIARKLYLGNASPRHGVFKPVIKSYLTMLNWKWTPTMLVGQGCKVHLKDNELPDGRLVVSVSKHLTAVIDGVLYDTHDCSRYGTRCVYGYWRQF